MTDNDALQNFNWDSYEQQVQGKQNQEELAKYDQSVTAVKAHEVVTGTVTAINKRDVVVNIGYKSEGVLPISEFRYNPDLKVGDKVEVYISNQENADGQLELSHTAARAAKSWDQVLEAFDKDEILKGFIKCRTKGGMIVDVLGTEAFLPGSQIDVKPIHDYDILVGKTIELKIVKINHEFKNVVVSHKALIEAEIEAQKREIISHLEKGQIIEGTVKAVMQYGVFMDLGGVDGLIHITDLSWGRVNDPHDILQEGQKVNVVILDFDEDRKRIALGLKQLTPHPWDALDPNLKVGDHIKGKVVVIADYGAFVEVLPGVEGLIHISEMSWSQHLRSASDFLQVGQEVESVVLSLDKEERKMSLGLKQLKPDPWETIDSKYPIGSKHTAKVRNFTTFGVFVELEEGVEGLIHISDLSWTKKIKHPNEFTSIGANIDVVVLEIDKDNRRLSLGHKQLVDNPWDYLETKYAVESVVEGKVIKIADKGATIALEEDIDGFCPTKHMQKEDGSKMKIDEVLPFKVIEFSRDSKRILLSHLRTWEPLPEKTETKTATPQTEKTTLGDLTALADLKLSMDEKKEEEKK